MKTLKINNKSSSEILYYSLLFIFGLLFCISYYITLRGSGGIIPEFYDFDEHWKASAYLFHGIDPFLSVNEAKIPEIGQMMTNFISVPWSYLLTTIYAPGFLPLDIARIYGMVVFIILVVLDIYCINKIFSKYFEFNIFITIGVFLLAYPKLVAVWIQGNNAIMVSSFVIYALYFLLENKQCISGIFLGFAMVKPQIAFLFFIPLLFMKKYRTILISVLIVMSTWIITAFILNENIFATLFASLERGMSQDGDNRYAGIFSILQLAGVSRKLCMMLSMALGLVIVITISWYISTQIKKYGSNFCMYIAFAATSAISPLWMYSSPGDFIVQFLLVAFMVIYFEKRNQIKNKDTQTYGTLSFFTPPDCF